MSDYDLKDVFDKVFRFRIGDVVCFKRHHTFVTAPIGEYVNWSAGSYAVIVERIINQCHGGVQFQYVIRGDGFTHQHVIEAELVSEDEMTEAFLDRRALTQERFEARMKARSEARAKEKADSAEPTP